MANAGLYNEGGLVKVTEKYNKLQTFVFNSISVRLITAQQYYYK